MSEAQGIDRISTGRTDLFKKVSMKISIGGKICIGYGLVLLALLLIGVAYFRNLKELKKDAG